jgi:hypothetical protein
MQLGAWVHLGLLALLHALQPGVSTTAAPVGAFVLGTGGFASVLATLALALAVASASVGALRAVPPGRSRTLSALLLALGAGTVVVSAIVPTDGEIPPTLPITASGWTHLTAAGLGLLLTLLGMLSFSLAMREDPRWMGSRTALWVLLVILGCAALAAGVAWSRGSVGAVQRVALVALSGWLVVAGVRVRRIRRGPDPPPGILARIQ